MDPVQIWIGASTSRYPECSLGPHCRSSNVDHSVLTLGDNGPNKLIAGPETADSIDPWHQRQGNPKLPEVVRDYLPLPVPLVTMMPVG